MNRWVGPVVFMLIGGFLISVGSCSGYLVKTWCSRNEVSQAVSPAEQETSRGDTQSPGASQKPCQVEVTCNTGNADNCEACERSLENSQDEQAECSEARAKLQADNDALREKEKLLEQRSNVYAAILAKWRLTLPKDEDLERFDIEAYFCKIWKLWNKKELPKVQQDYKDSGCCDCSSDVKQKTKTHRKKKIQPPPPPPTPPKPTPPKERFIPGPTAPCPDPE